MPSISILDPGDIGSRRRRCRKRVPCSTKQIHISRWKDERCICVAGVFVRQGSSQDKSEIRGFTIETRQPCLAIKINEQRNRGEGDLGSFVIRHPPLSRLITIDHL